MLSWAKSSMPSRLRAAISPCRRFSRAENSSFEKCSMAFRDAVKDASTRSDRHPERSDVGPFQIGRNVAPDGMIAEIAPLHLSKRLGLRPVLEENATKGRDQSRAVGAVLAMQEDGPAAPFPADGAQCRRHGVLLD